jgi:hypothetical protein
MAVRLNEAMAGVRLGARALGAQTAQLRLPG